ncbi:MAG: hypothetical protein NTY11_02715, partial [Candidatus Parcubacteria bacterium]|nr:hypothetical protein [Candidatus Parcubacteria bacterium]
VEQCGVEECHFDYRTSVFKKNKNFIIISCELELKKGEKENIKQKIDSYKNYRVEHHPLNYPSAGSVFKNPEATEKIIKDYPEIVKNGIVPAGFLIEQAGLKGKVIGGAQISEKHCNFIINLGNATAKDILELIKIVKENVENKFKINLEEEIFVF